MANHASAEKRNRQRLTRTARNRAVTSYVRKVLKLARIAIDSGADDAPTLVHNAHKVLDRAAAKNVLPSRRASRLKSRLSLRLGRVQQQQQQ